MIRIQWVDLKAFDAPADLLCITKNQLMSFIVITTLYIERILTLYMIVSRGQWICPMYMHVGPKVDTERLRGQFELSYLEENS